MYPMEIISLLAWIALMAFAVTAPKGKLWRFALAFFLPGLYALVVLVQFIRGDTK